MESCTEALARQHEEIFFFPPPFPALIKSRVPQLTTTACVRACIVSLHQCCLLGKGLGWALALSVYYTASLIIIYKITRFPQKNTMFTSNTVNNDCLKEHYICIPLTKGMLR